MADGGLVHDRGAHSSGRNSALRRKPRGLWTALTTAGCAVALLAGPTRTAFAEPPLTPLELRSEGGTPQIPGEALPPPGSKLPQKPVEAPPAPPPVVAPPPPVVQPIAPPKPVPPAVVRKAPPPLLKSALEVSVGPVWLPSGAWQLFSKLDHHPELYGLGIDLAWHVPLSGRNSLAIRGGVTLPNVPSANWYASSSNELPMWTVVKLTLIDIAAEYVNRTPLSDRVDFTVRAGAGLLILAGDVDRTETLPICTAAKRDTCPHWRHVADGKADLLSRVWPALRATVGAEWSPTPTTVLHLDLGLRDGLYAGAGGALRF